MMGEELISIVIPTRNSGKTLGHTLRSISAQTHKNHEVIIADGCSSDDTCEIARRFGVRLISSKASLPGARNEGFRLAKGSIFMSIDSDMILSPAMLEEVAAKMGSHGALVLPEEGYGRDFISRCKDLEKRCYIGDSIVEAARAFRRDAFEAVGGYDPGLLFAEDWDIFCRIREKFSIGRVDSRIKHNTEGVSFLSNLRKAYRYGYTLPRYLAKGHRQAEQWLDPRNFFFIRHMWKLKDEPVHAAGLLLIKGSEYAAGMAGFLGAKLGWRA